MRKFRVHLALALCAGAGVCGLLAWHWDALRIGLVGPLALWFGAGAFLWKASQALLGKIGLPQEQPPAQPVVPHPPSGAPGDATVAAAAARRPLASPGGPEQCDAGRRNVRSGRRSADARDGGRLRWHGADRVAGLDRAGPRSPGPPHTGSCHRGIVSLYRGDLPQGGIMLGTAGFFTWYCCGPLRGRWQTEATALVDDGTGE